MALFMPPGERLVRTLLALMAVALAVGARGGTTDEIDYGRAEAWLALPGQPSTASLTPRESGFSDLQARARADVFYVHPTTGMREDVQNVPIDDADALRLGQIMLMSQATPFNASARVYAPRYRQMALPVFERGEEALQAPMNLAYADVRRAFEHYIAHYNDGRPFFLVAHSQGSNHALRLLSEAIQGTPLERRLIAAYLPGNPTPRSVFDDDLARIPPCEQPEQTGCVAVWGSFGEGYADFAAWESINVYWDKPRRRWRASQGQPLVNLNPVTWRADSAPAPTALHRGAVPFGVPATHFGQSLAGLVSARSDGRYTFITPTPLPPALFDDGGVFGGANYHVFDINLFWVDIRENARRRLTAYLRRAGAAYPLIDGPSAFSAEVGGACRQPIALTNRPGVVQVQGLPEGLAYDPGSGAIQGVPRQAGVYALAVTATNAAGTDTAELVLTVKARTDVAKGQPSATHRLACEDGRGITVTFEAAAGTLPSSCPSAYRRPTSANR